MFDFRVQTFLAVCKTMNYTKAADLLGLTQPAVSQHIHWLEEQYDVKLFLYRGKKLTLTDAGIKMQTAFTTIQHDLQSLAKNIKNQKQTLSFGVTPTVGTYLIPKPLANYKRQFPYVEINMQVDNTAKLCMAIDKGELDFAIVEGYFHKNNYDALLYKTEKYMAVCSADMKIDDNISKLAELVSFPIIIREQGSGNREIIIRSLSRHNLSINDFKSIIQISDLHALKALLLEGAGIAFMYHAAVKNEIEQGKLRQIILDDFNEEHEITFIWRKNSVYSDKYRQIHNLLKP